MVRCESRSSTIGHITLDTKQTGAPSAGNPHAGCDVAGAGNGFTVRLLRHSQRKRGAKARLDLRNTAPVLDPTGLYSPIARFWRLGDRPRPPGRRSSLIRSVSRVSPWAIFRLLSPGAGAPSVSMKDAIGSGTACHRITSNSELRAEPLHSRFPVSYVSLH